MSQTKRDSIKEVLFNTTIGGLLAWGITYSVVKNVENAAYASMLSVVLCTLASLIRGYVIRRHFANRVVPSKPDVATEIIDLHFNVYSDHVEIMKNGNLWLTRAENMPLYVFDSVLMDHFKIYSSQYKDQTNLVRSVVLRDESFTGVSYVLEGGVVVITNLEFCESLEREGN